MKKIFFAAALLCFAVLNAKVTELVVFPADWQGQNYSFLENYPATLAIQFLGEGKKLALEPPTAVWEVPAFLRLHSVTSRARWAKHYSFTSESFTEKGRRMTRYKIQFPKNLLRGLNPKRYGWRHGFNCTFLAESGFAGKNCDFRFYFLEKGKRTFERNYKGTLLPPAKFPSSPLKYFKAGINWLSSINHHDTEALRLAAAFWRAFDSRPYHSVCWENFDFPRERNLFLDKNFAAFVTGYATKQSTLKFPGTSFTDLGFLINGKVVRPGVPLFVNAAGKTVQDAICPRYLIADPEGLFWGEYFKRGFNNMLKHVPSCRDIWLDYEPFVTEGTCDDCLKDLGVFAKLNRTPKREEIRDGKSLNRKWREFKAIQHRKILEKFVAAAKKHFPGHRIHLCTATPGKNYLNTWHCIDSSTVANKVFAFNPMNYTVGTGYFEGVEKQEQILGRTKNISWTDPSENIERFYKRYSPKKILQNIIATAVLGADGFVVYPTDILDGVMLNCIATGFRGVKEVEDILFRGKNISSQIKYRPLNVIKARLEDEKGKLSTTLMPDFSRDLKVRAKEKGGVTVLALFNYSLHDIFVEVSLPRFRGKGTVSVFDLIADEKFTGINADMLRRGIRIRIPVDGCRLIRIGGKEKGGKAVTQQAVSAELKNYMRSFSINKDLFQSKKQGDSAITWVKRRKAPVIRLSQQQQYLLIDPASALVTSWRNAKGTPVGGKDPHLGKMFFFSTANSGVQEYKFAGTRLTGKSASARFVHTVPKDAGFGEENPLAGLQVEKTFTLKDVTKTSGTLETRITFRNPGKTPMTFGFRIQHIPLANWAVPAFLPQLTLDKAKADTEAFYLKKNAAVNWFEVKTPRYLPGPLNSQVEARWYKYLFSAPEAAGFYSWSNLRMVTSEHLFSDVTLPGGKSRTFLSTMVFKLK